MRFPASPERPERSLESTNLSQVAFPLTEANNVWLELLRPNLDFEFSLLSMEYTCEKWGLDYLSIWGDLPTMYPIVLTIATLHGWLGDSAVTNLLYPSFGKPRDRSKCFAVTDSDHRQLQGPALCLRPRPLAMAPQLSINVPEPSQTTEFCRQHFFPRFLHYWTLP
jgi:hypothetical protein